MVFFVCVVACFGVVFDFSCLCPGIESPGSVSLLGNKVLVTVDLPANI